MKKKILYAVIALLVMSFGVASGIWAWKHKSASKTEDVKEVVKTTPIAVTYGDNNELQWDDVKSADKYELSIIRESKLTDTKTIKDNSFRFEELDAGNYQFTVRALNQQKEEIGVGTLAKEFKESIGKPSPVKQLALVGDLITWQDTGYNAYKVAVKKQDKIIEEKTCSENKFDISVFDLETGAYSVDVCAVSDEGKDGTKTNILYSELGNSSFGKKASKDEYYIADFRNADDRAFFENSGATMLDSNVLSYTDAEWQEKAVWYTLPYPIDWNDVYQVKIKTRVSEEKGSGCYMYIYNERDVEQGIYPEQGWTGYGTESLVDLGNGWCLTTFSSENIRKMTMNDSFWANGEAKQLSHMLFSAISIQTKVEIESITYTKRIPAKDFDILYDGKAVKQEYTNMDKFHWSMLSATSEHQVDYRLERNGVKVEMTDEQRLKPGNYTITASIRGLYSGKSVAEFTVVEKDDTIPNRVTGLSYKNGTLSWKGVEGVNGYRIYASYQDGTLLKNGFPKTVNGTSSKVTIPAGYIYLSVCSVTSKDTESDSSFAIAVSEGKTNYNKRIGWRSFVVADFDHEDYKGFLSYGDGLASSEVSDGFLKYTVSTAWEPAVTYILPEPLNASKVGEFTVRWKGERAVLAFVNEEGETVDALLFGNSYYGITKTVDDDGYYTSKFTFDDIKKSIGGMEEKYFDWSNTDCKITELRFYSANSNKSAEIDYIYYSPAESKSYPSKVTNLKYKDGTLTWDAVKTATSYCIYAESADGEPYLVGFPKEVKGTSAKIELPIGYYNLSVSAVTSKDVEGECATVSASIKGETNFKASLDAMTRVIADFNNKDYYGFLYRGKAYTSYAVENGMLTYHAKNNWWEPVVTYVLPEAIHVDDLELLSVRWKADGARALLALVNEKGETVTVVLWGNAYYGVKKEEKEDGYNITSFTLDDIKSCTGAEEVYKWENDNCKIVEIQFLSTSEVKAASIDYIHDTHHDSFYNYQDDVLGGKVIADFKGDTLGEWQERVSAKKLTVKDGDLQLKNTWSEIYLPYDLQLDGNHTLSYRIKATGEFQSSLYSNKMKKVQFEVKDGEITKSIEGLSVTTDGEYLICSISFDDLKAAFGSGTALRQMDFYGLNNALDYIIYTPANVAGQPDKVTGLSYKDNKLSWTAVTGAESYRIYATNQDGTAVTEGFPKTVNSTSAEVVLPVGKYTLSVRAISSNNVAGERGWLEVMMTGKTNFKKNVSDFVYVLADFNHDDYLSFLKKEKTTETFELSDGALKYSPTEAWEYVLTYELPEMVSANEMSKVTVRWKSEGKPVLSFIDEDGKEAKVYLYPSSQSWYGITTTADDNTGYYLTTFTFDALKNCGGADEVYKWINSDCKVKAIKFASQNKQEITIDYIHYQNVSSFFDYYSEALGGKVVVDFDTAPVTNKEFYYREVTVKDGCMTGGWTEYYLPDKIDLSGSYELRIRVKATGSAWIELNHPRNKIGLTDGVLNTDTTSNIKKYVTVTDDGEYKIVTVRFSALKKHCGLNALTQLNFTVSGGGAIDYVIYTSATGIDPEESLNFKKPVDGMENTYILADFESDYYEDFLNLGSAGKSYNVDGGYLTYQAVNNWWEKVLSFELPEVLLADKVGKITVRWKGKPCQVALIDENGKRAIMLGNQGSWYGVSTTQDSDGWYVTTFTINSLKNCGGNSEVWNWTDSSSKITGIEFLSSSGVEPVMVDYIYYEALN